jgi:hypothetical protein
MRNLLALLAALVLAFIGIGWYLGWYQVKTETTVLSGHQKVDIDINSTKIVSDVKKGKEMVDEMRKNAASSTPDATTTTNTATTTITPHE